MLKDEKRNILEKNYLLNKRSDARKKNRFLTVKHRCFLLAIFLSIAILFLFYYFSPSSNIFRITVSGDSVLDEKEIIKKSGLTTDDKFLLFSASSVEKKLEKDPFIKKADVIRKNGSLVEIVIEEEKLIGYSYDQGDAVVLFADDRQEKMDMDTLYLIEKLPLISGYRGDDLNFIRIGFKDIDHDTIKEISEIHCYPFSYDDKMMEVIMKDGNYVFTSTFGLKMLDHYYSILSSLNLHNKNVCIYLDEVTNSGYVSACPWEIPEEPEEPVQEEPVEEDME